MPTIKSVTVYQYSELSEPAQEKARNWMRERFDFNYHAETVLDDAKTIGALFGLDIDDIFYSGFYSQGDGACFTGDYKYQKGASQVVKDSAPMDTELHRIVRDLQDCQRKAFYKLTASCYNRYRGNNMTVDVGSDGRLSEYMEDDIIIALRDFADWIYRSLEKEYEFQTSDEQVTESIESADYLHFTEDGKVA
jgi:hypothetical protein